jgi:signal transduction histidine kinase
MKPFHSKRLYVQLYLVMLASTLACLLLVGVAFRVLREEVAPGPPPRFEHGLGEMMPPSGALEPPRFRFRRRGWPIHPFSVTLGALAVVMAAASYPIARRLTRRLELLAAGVERWGEGELAHRLPIEGADEVATLAAVFNQAAARVDRLVEQQRQLLANTSHELRSPLARVRLGLELAVEETDPARRARRVDDIRRDIVELDALIEELLLFARADSHGPRRAFEIVPLRALAESEVARACPGAAVVGAELEVRGDAQLLRHVVRNLLENAAHHGGGRDVRVRLEATPAEVILAVEDGGPGIPREDHERIFAPFFRRPGPAAAPGHGVGLALVRQVARYHGGEARYVAPEGGGSRFEVSLPRVTSGATGEAQGGEAQGMSAKQ